MTLLWTFYNIRTFSVGITDFCHGVPQGSILGTLFFQFTCFSSVRLYKDMMITDSCLLFVSAILAVQLDQVLSASMTSIRQKLKNVMMTLVDDKFEFLWNWPVISTSHFNCKISCLFLPILLFFHFWCRWISYVPPPAFYIKLDMNRYEHHIFKYKVYSVFLILKQSPHNSCRARG